jgi:hypothetical protein
LTFFQLLLGPANATFSGYLLLGILNPADELVAGQWSDVLPGIECREIGDQRGSQVYWKLVDDPTRDSLAAHEATVAVPMTIELFYLCECPTTRDFDRCPATTRTVEDPLFA